LNSALETFIEGELQVFLMWACQLLLWKFVGRAAIYDDEESVTAAVMLKLPRLVISIM